ncbi:hypothetical protein F2Q70_00025252 [Brassica cretica]|uniref:Uncharacterized protein n=1 Tax=Brassica cretica TaxID=69181 RepID=A0A8S9LA50_BRACR|nr:hypothetical protein F2Q70_00025252 [Brassica cretica]
MGSKHLTLPNSRDPNIDLSDSLFHGEQDGDCVFSFVFSPVKSTTTAATGGTPFSSPTHRRQPQRRFQCFSRLSPPLRFSLPLSACLRLSPPLAASLRLSPPLSASRRLSVVAPNSQTPHVV